MKKTLSFFSFFIITFLLSAQEVPSSFYQELEYRCIGPFRASRTVGAVGIPSQPNVFFVGVNNGGVWKTDDYGRTWNPIFDDAPTGSVGDVAVSPTNPDIIYVGSGEGLHRPDLGVGDGVFKSTDGGKSWKLMGLTDVQQVARLIVHPTDPDIVYVAGLGHPYGANEQRGVFRTKDGGQSWEKVLYIDHNTGATQVIFDPTNPNILFASVWEHREGPWENARFLGKNSGLYKSTDGGDNWEKITEGLPSGEQGLGRVGVAIAPSNPDRMYATVDAGDLGGVYISNDAGQSWSRVTTDYRIWGRGGDFAELQVHPNNPDVLFSANIASYRSDDAGKTWTSIKGAPGGDDYHRIWINPNNPDIMIFAADQGATITVNGGRTWSSWYNQPTAQIYHVTTDNQFPYWVYGGQQESGAIGTASRGNGGQISFREFMGVGADEYAYIAPDPLNPDIIYGGRVMKFNKKTGQSQNVAPEALRSGKYRILRTMPLLFHPADPKTLLFATNVLWKTTDGGHNWQIISPDLSRPRTEVPESVGDFKTPEMETMARRGVIYAVGPSPLLKEIIWAGTDDGQLHITNDGGASWINVTEGELNAWDKVSQVDASHFDPSVAYVAINAIRKDDMRPHIFRVRRDLVGAIWEPIVNGLPENGPVNVVREDPVQPGLLFAGTEREVYFSVDDGANWQSLRNNMPATSIRDLVIHENDLVVGTHGRSIWIMDDISPLREMAQVIAEGKTYLFDPAATYRVRWNMFSDTPLPPEEPAGENPPDGALLDYYLPSDADEVKLEIISPKGWTVRAFSSEDEPENIDTTSLPHPTYWIRPQQEVSAEAGHHRLVWDLRWTPPKDTRRQFSIAAVYKRTPSGPQGPFVHPGTYTVRLTVDGQVQEKSIEVKMDPRVEISEEDLQLQTNYSMACYAGFNEAGILKKNIEDILKGDISSQIRKKLEAVIGNRKPGNPDTMYGSIYDTSASEETIMGLQNKFLFMLNLLQQADARPTSQALEGVQQLRGKLKELEQRYLYLLIDDDK
jgi:photosystem II stability/assembly factor-like uncharacterized protein